MNANIAKVVHMLALPPTTGKLTGCHCETQNILDFGSPDICCVNIVAN